jgi:autotransporter-associated beta strand protein
MKMLRNSRILLALLLAISPLATTAATFFSDNFSSGSTTNGTSIPGGTPTASYTSYDIASTKNGLTSVINPGDFTLKLAAPTTSGWVEAQALFTTSPVSLTQVNDYIELTVVFTNTSGSLLAGGTASLLWVGLYNSGDSEPLAGALANAGLTTVAGSAFATGNCADWKGYISSISSNGTSRIYTRPLQNGPNTTSANQELVGDNAGSGAFNNPRAATLVTGPTTSISLTPGGQYTLLLRITLSAANTLTISNSLFDGAGTAGTVLFSQSATNVSGANLLTADFDGLCIGIFNKGVSINPIMDMTSILITGQSTVVTTPPDITSQPVAVTVPNGGSCAFSVGANGFNLSFQWNRNGTNLVDGGNISGATSDTLIISPVGPADVASGANGYYATVFGAGGFSTNSEKVSLALGTAKNLTWAGPGATWDLNTSANWQDAGNNPSVFNYGDSVTFNGASPTGVTLTGTFLSASSVTVEGNTGYSFSGTGSFAGLGALIFTGTFLDMGNANTYSGGTIISNASAYLYLRNYNGLGTGPVTLAKAGGLMEIVPTGSATLGVKGDIIVADDFTIQFDGVGAFAGVLFGNLSGTAGKTLTFNPKDLSTTNRYRVYGASTVYDGNLVLNGPATSQANYGGTTLAMYNASGSQTYNGIISGNGGLIQRANGTTILNGANTYTGGTTPTTGAIGFGTDTVGGVTAGPIGTGPLFLSPELPNLTGSGTVFASGGSRTIANPLQYPSATNNFTLIVGGANDLTFSGPYTLNGNDGLGAPTNRTIRVTNLSLTTISGVISDGGLGFGLIKTGNGTLVLSNTETYTGPTTVSNGSMVVNGQLATGGVTVAAGGLSGTGTILGPVTVLAFGSLAPGDPMGTLTINNNLTLAGNLWFWVNNSAVPNYNNMVVTGTLTNTGTGTLTFINLGSALAPGNTFTLFNKAVANGDALTITGAGVIWTNKLAVDGTIAVLSTIPTTPTNISYALSGNTLTLNWPNNYLGWSLQSNSVGVTSTANWFTVTNSSSGTNFVITVDPAKTNVFYRLIYSN